MARPHGQLPPIGLISTSSLAPPRPVPSWPFTPPSKFGNIAGMAFYSMLMVTISGFVGRYLYAHIPRGLSAGGNSP